MDHPDLTVSICMEKFICLQRVKKEFVMNILIGYRMATQEDMIKRSTDALQAVERLYLSVKKERQTCREEGKVK